MLRYIDSNLLTGKEKDLASLSNKQLINLQDNLTKLFAGKMKNYRIVLDKTVHRHLSVKKTVFGERIGGLLVHDSGAILDVFGCGNFKQLREYLSNKTIAVMNSKASYLDFLIANNVVVGKMTGIHDLLIKDNKLYLNEATPSQPRFVAYNSQLTSLVKNLELVTKLMGIQYPNSRSAELEGLFLVKTGNNKILIIKNSTVTAINLTKKALATSVETSHALKKAGLLWLVV